MGVLFSSNVRADKAAPLRLPRPMPLQGLCSTILIVWLGAYAYTVVAGAPGIISSSTRKD